MRDRRRRQRAAVHARHAVIVIAACSPTLLLLIALDRMKVAAMPVNATIPATQNIDVSCWKACGSVSGGSGRCVHFCGLRGACCRQGWDADEADCRLPGVSFTCSGRHCCVEIPASSPLELHLQNEAEQLGETENVAHVLPR